MLIGGTDDCHASVSAVSLRRLTSLLVAILLALAVTACGTLSAPETPANQRYGYVYSAVEIIWDAAPDADSYTIFSGGSDCRVESGRPVNCEELDSDIEETSYLHHILGGETDNYWVVACNRLGCSAIDTANPALPLPPAPDILGIEQVGSSLRITWSPVPGATHYKVYHNQEIPRCTPSTAYPQCEELAGNVVGTTYTHAIPVPPRPYDLKVIERTSDSITIAWPERYHSQHYWFAACTDVGCSAINTDYTPDEFVATNKVLPRYYLIYRQPKGLTEKEIKYEPAGARSNHFRYVDKGLQAGTIYYYRIYACNDSGCSDGYMGAEGMTEAQGPVDPPSTPTGFKAEQVEKGEPPENAGASWNVVEGATYYELWRGTAPSRPLTLHMTLSAPVMLICSEQRDNNRVCFYDGSLNRGNVGIEFSTTSYKIRACNKAGCSPFTETVTLDWGKQ